MAVEELIGGPCVLPKSNYGLINLVALHLSPAIDLLRKLWEPDFDALAVLFESSDFCETQAVIDTAPMLSAIHCVASLLQP